jgi:hypothetical protein
MRLRHLRESSSLENGLGYASAACQRAAGKHADVATLATAHQTGMKCTAAIMTGAARCNKLAEVQYLHNQGCPWPFDLLEKAASSGYFELLRWCYEHGCRWGAPGWGPYHPATSGNIELMFWTMQQPGAVLTAEVMWAAVLKGDAAMCQYLRAQQCPWNSMSTERAAENGDTDLLIWLVDNGCPGNLYDVCIAAAKGGNAGVLIHLQQEGLLSDTELLTELMQYAGRCKYTNAAKWLKEQGADWPNRFTQPWSREVIEWALTEGFTLPTTWYH